MRDVLQIIHDLNATAFTHEQVGEAVHYYGTAKDEHARLLREAAAELIRLRQPAKPSSTAFHDKVHAWLVARSGEKRDNWTIDQLLAAVDNRLACQYHCVNGVLGEDGGRPVFCDCPLGKLREQKRGAQ